ncbi:MAG: MarR family transcriptional regulator [Desulfobacterales bacterium]|nr:MarR family transcriptional regulator [Desulfobacterales bacterium]MDJ0855100.1 MarR family transcriptional regulator [Desulfobacterales bacterium]MDJ0887203.1 MarR family transcriptional regulator [Desulfobacterales bacterium]MDJ0988709.1 MarR family transcriptional regulator [Desulfobacterales bacterium]
MGKENLAEQARYIFTTGRAIRDFVDRNIAQLLAAEGNRSACGELSVNQMHALMLIQKRGKVSISELALLLGVSAPSASALVDRMVEKSVLTREPSTKDRRRMDVRIAPSVQEDFERVNAVLLAAFERLVEKAGAETANMWCEVLERLKRVLDAEEAAARSKIPN